MITAPKRMLGFLRRWLTTAATVAAVTAMPFSHAGCGGSPAPTATGTRQVRPDADSVAAPLRERANPLTATGRYPARYRIEVPRQPEGQEPHRLRLTLWLAREGVPRRIDLPALPGRQQRRSQVRDVTCHPGDEVVAQAEEGWSLPAGCERITYDVIAAEPDGKLLRDRVTQHGPEGNQWLLHGAGIFLVPERLSVRPIVDLGGTDTPPFTHALGGAGPVGLRLPPPSSLGRVIFGVGDFEANQSLADGTRYLHHRDHLDEAPLQGFEAGMELIHDVLGTTPPAVVHVYWQGRPFEEGVRLYGTSGIDSVAVQYWTGLTTDVRASTRKAPLAVAFQQLFVALAGPRVPAWLTESAGQYVALLAWRESGAIDDRGLEAVIRSSAVRRPTTTVPAAYALWQESGSDEDYRTFFRHGLGFWATLARTLRERGSDETVLDLVGTMLSLVYRSDGHPPERFFELMEQAAGADAAGRTRRWIGSE